MRAFASFAYRLQRFCLRASGRLVAEVNQVAHFVNVEGERISNLPVTLRPGKLMDFGLWGYRDTQGLRLNVDIVEVTNTNKLPIGRVELTRELGDICYFRVQATAEGAGRMAATATNNSAVWDSFGFAVSASAPVEITGLDKLVTAMDEKKLIFQHTNEPATLRAAAEGNKRVFYGAIHGRVSLVAASRR